MNPSFEPSVGEPTTASDPGRLPLSVPMLLAVHPEMAGWRRLWRTWSRHVGHFADDFDDLSFAAVQLHIDTGDTRAAVVLDTAPLLVAAYTDEFDCIAMLRFPDHLADRHALAVGDRLVTTNSYCTCGGDDLDWPDTDHPTAAHGRSLWTNFTPYIGDFLSDDGDRLRQLKRRIGPAEWRRCRELGERYRRDFPTYCRDGRPGAVHAWRRHARPPQPDGTGPADR